MDDFERLFLLAYTAYTIISIGVLMWAGREVDE
jgi:hypothetical protein